MLNLCPIMRYASIVSKTLLLCSR